MLSRKSTHGSLLLFQKGNTLLGVDGFIPLNIIQIAQLIGIRRDLLLRDLLNLMELTILIFETSSPVAKLISIWVILSLVGREQLGWSS